ncbi:MAG: hypothetical protein MZV70_06860 [Desulfobacterales bacterium]|nr:hypothetical protein [Desulfobacterales bacterium]
MAHGTGRPEAAVSWSCRGPPCARSGIDFVRCVKVDPDPVKVNAPAAIALDKDCVPA